MSAAEPAAAPERLLEFEVGGERYALPITAVAEVTELERIAAVPTLPLEVGGVTNHHGDALPVLRRGALFEVEEGRLPQPQHLLVLSGSREGAPGLGLPVDRVVGLAEPPESRARRQGPLAEVRPPEGRDVTVLEPARLLGRAASVIRNAVGGTAAQPQGDSDD